MSVADVLFEVDAGSSIGMGHLSRCKTLATALRQEGATCVFRIHGDAPAQTAAFPFALAREGQICAAVVIDRYTISAEEIAQARRAHGVSLIFDDHAARPVETDLLLNGNYYARDLDYGSFKIGQALLGPRFALVTRAFVEAADVTGEKGATLVSFGLSAISALAIPLAEALAQAEPDLSFMVVVPQDRRPPGFSHPRVRLVAPAPLAELVRRVEFAVTGLGVTWQEMAATGRKTVGVRLVDNQDLMAAATKRDGFPIALSPRVADVLPQLRAARRGGEEAAWSALRRELDGEGPQRAARELIKAV